MLADRIQYDSEKEEKTEKSITLTDDNAEEVLAMIKYKGKIIKKDEHA